MDWKEYEQEIHQIFSSQYPNSDIQHDIKRKGIYSNIDRQIDILIEDHIAGNRFSIVIDCKYFNKKVDIKVLSHLLGYWRTLEHKKDYLYPKKALVKLL